MINKVTTLSVIITSILVSACAGNNIKTQDTTIDKQPTNNIELSANTEVVLSDFPVEATVDDSDLKPDTSSAQNDTNGKDQLNSNQPKIKLVNFKYDKFEISDKDKNLLKQHANFLVANPTYVLAVNGHSDYRGPEVYNEKLSLRRANSVATLLVSFGASESQLIINSFGASQPVEDFDNWFQNRRVELEYSELYMVSK